jgi:nitrogen-specific signal transduction histidine kinase
MTKPVLLTVDDDPEVLNAIERNGGSIELESEPGRTEFRVALPVAQ